MTLERRFRGALLATAVLSLMAYGAAEQSMGLLLLAVVGAVSGWWVTEGRGPVSGWNGLPRWVSSLTLVLMLVVAIMRALEGQREVVTAFTGFLASIIVVKLWERRELRDYAQILTMSLFMTVGATLTDNSLLIGLLLLAQLPVFVVTVMLFQIYAGAQRVREASWQGSRGADEKPVVEWPQVGRAFKVMSLVTVFAGVTIAVLIFVLVPRGIGLDQWGEFARPKGKQTTGFTDQVEPGKDDVISLSQVPVMDVTFREADSTLMGGADQSFYLRGAVLDVYDGSGRWTKSKLVRGGLQSLPMESGQQVPIGPRPAGGKVVTQVISMREATRGDSPIFGLYRPVSVMLAKVDQAQNISFDPLTGWILRQGDGSKLSYQVISVVDPPTPEVAVRATGVSFPSERIRVLATQLLRQSRFEPDVAKRPIADDGAAARVFETYLRNNYEYTLLPDPAKGDPTEYFLFESKRGHCEYFASALAAMCRSVGIEARVVAGYLANEYDQERHAYVVRASDAHAWVEVNTGPTGWQRRDATPAETLRDVHDSRRSLVSRLQRLAATIQDLWNSTVVTFDQSAQERLLGQGVTHQNLLDRGLDSLRGVVTKLHIPMRSRARWAASGMLIGAAFLFIGMTWVIWRALRRRNGQGADGGGWAMRGAERKAYRELLSVLAWRGHPKPEWLPPCQHLESVAKVDEEFAAAAQQVVSLLYTARFGPGGTVELAEARARLKGLRGMQKRMPLSRGGS